MSSSTTTADRTHVTAVLVSHDGATWIPRAITALQGLDRPADALICVDTGSRDDSGALLSEAFGDDATVTVDRATGFGTAVHAGLDAADGSPVDPEHSWVWLLHDDCAPDPGALGALLEVGASDPAIGIVGGRVRAWPRARRLLEIGVTITGTGRRETGLEPGEHDQGQYEEIRDVLAVGTAGLLVRRSVWDQLGGLDPDLPLFRDDVDLGWRATAAGHRVVYAPDAVIFHAEAATRGIRPLDAVTGSAHRADRRAALFTLLANAGSLGLVWSYLRLTFGSLLRVLFFFFGKLPSAAWDELCALGAVLARPDRVLAARKRRRALGRPDRAAVSAVRPAWWWPYGHGLDVARTRLAERWHEVSTSVASRRRDDEAEQESAFDATRPDEEYALPEREGPVAWLRRHPLVSVTVVLVLAALVAGRSLLGSGPLHGGALLPAPESMGQWWTLYRESWHDVGIGSDLDTSPFVALLLVPGVLLLGHAGAVVDVLMIGAVPLAWLGAYAASRRLFDGVATRVSVAATYALLPVLGGAVTSGHVGTVVGLILLPWVVRAVVGLLDPEVRDPGRRCFSTGLLLAALVAFVPIAWPIAAVVLLAGAVWALARRRWVRAAGAVGAALLPVLALVPWSFRLLDDPALLLSEAGRIEPVSGGLGVDWWQLVAGRLGAAGEAPWWLTVVVVVLALLAFARPQRWPQVASAWFVAAVGAVALALMAGQVVEVPGTGREVAVWLGFPLLLAVAALVVAAGFALDGAAADPSRPRRLAATVAAVVLGLVPAAGLVWWVGTAPEGDLHRSPAVDLPAYLVEDLAEHPGFRVLQVSTQGDAVTYAVLTGDGRRLGDDSVLPEKSDPALTRTVGDLLSQSDPAVARTLTDQDISYVVLNDPVTPAYVNELDGTAGLSRASSQSAYGMAWQVQGAGDASATTVTDDRGRWLLGQAAVVLVCLVLAAPGARREEIG